MLGKKPAQILLNKAIKNEPAEQQAHVDPLCIALLLNFRATFTRF